MATKKPCHTRTTGLLPDGSVPTCAEGSTQTIFWYLDEAVGCLEKGTKNVTVSKQGKNCISVEEYLDKDGQAFTSPPNIQTPSYVVATTCSNEPIPEITIDGQDCAGAPVSVTGQAGSLTSVVQAPGTVFSVKLCEEDRDFELACGKDPATGHDIQTAYKITNGDFVLIKRWDVVTGAEWTGDPSTLEGCGGTKYEAEKQLMCDNGTEFLRWFVLKNGLPTGQFVDTDFAGATYTPTGTVSHGACVVACAPSISSSTADALGSLLPGHSVSIQKDNCCALKVTTSAGSFIVSKDFTGYSTGDFDCTVTVTAVEVLSGTCSLADVIVTTQKKR